jgi:4-hydroxymandelate oxidase
MSADELEEQARARLNPTIFDFVAGGSGDEVTVAANRAAFRAWRLRPRVLTEIGEARLATEVLGTGLGLPVIVPPMGSHWLLHPEGEAATAAGAAAAGAGFALSSDSPRAIAAVAAAAGPARWYQLYFRSDRAAAAALVDAAEASGYRALLVTVDVPVLGNRRRDMRHAYQGGRGAPLGDQPEPAVSPDGRFHPDLRAFAPTTWADLDWLRARTRLPVVVKGILDPADAEMAIEHGMAGVVVSNHGGRQLDHAMASLEALPEIVEAVAGRVPVLLDGGVRSGTDVAIALCLGASAVGVGRPVLWALAVDGAAGVERLLRGLAADLARTLVLLGVSSVADLGPHLLRRAGP